MSPFAVPRDDPTASVARAPTWLILQRVNSVVAAYMAVSAALVVTLIGMARALLVGIFVRDEVVVRTTFSTRS